MDLNNLINDSQNKIDNLFKEIDLIKKELGNKLEESLKSEDIESFGDSYERKYYGIAVIGIDEQSYYYIPENHLEEFPDSYYTPGTWISSSETC